MKYLLLVVFGFQIPQLYAELVTPSIFNNGTSNDFYPKTNLTNDSGLTGDIHDFANASNAWVTYDSGTDYFDVGPPVVILFDLGVIETHLDALVYWGYVLDGTGTAEGNEGKSFRLTFSADQTIDGNDPVETVTATQPTGRQKAIIPFSTQRSARYVKMEILDNFAELSGGDRVGLGEVKFGRNSTVLTNADSGPGSLRQVITDSLPGSEIGFAPALDGATIRVLSQLIIDKDLTIDASALPDGITIDGGSNGDFTMDPDETRCFMVDDGNNSIKRSVIFKNLTIRNGISQGANVFTREDLTLMDCRILNGRAFGSGTGTHVAKGGGIYAEFCNLSLTDCSVSGNRTQGTDGGGGGLSLRDHATLALLRCSVTDNRTIEPAYPGNTHHAEGGGIFLESSVGPSTLDRCTISGNRAAASTGGGLFYLSDSMISISHCTIVGNVARQGAGIMSNSPVSVSGSIVRDNEGSNDIDTPASSAGAYTSGGGNLVGSLGTGVTGFGSGEISLAPVLLAELGEYGGKTVTMPPLSGSPVINHAAADPSYTDQRGFAVTGNPDTGAAESNLFFLVNTLSDAPDASGLSLRTAIGVQAFNPQNGIMIQFDPAVFTAENHTIQLTTGEISFPLPTALTIYANNLPSGVTIDAGGQSRVAHISGAGPVTFAKLHLTHGKSPDGQNGQGAPPFPVTPGTDGGDGGAVLNQGILNMINCSVTDSTCGKGGTGGSNEAGKTGGSGGGIFSMGTVSLSRCTLSGNRSGDGGLAGSGQLGLSPAPGAGGHGGALAIQGHASLRSCTLASNSAGDGKYSGSVFFPGGGAGGSGGGIFVISGGADITGCTISANSAGFSGGSTSLPPEQAGGGGIGNPANTPLRMTSSIVAGNFPDNLAGNAVTIACLTSGDPLLSPLGMYGGFSETLLPLTGSPAVDAAGENAIGSTDQRGEARVYGNAADIGAVEFQGNPAEVLLALDHDPDRDGTPSGVELVLGTLPFVSDPGNPKTFRILPSGGGAPSVTFGYTKDYESSIILKITRSTDLIHFTDVLASSETTNFPDSGTQLLVMPDINPPPGGKAFYRLEAVRK